MSELPTLSSSELERLRALDTCTASNAIERFNVRMRNEGFAGGSIHCRFPNLSPMLGYAVPCRIRTAEVPVTHRCYHDRMDWWGYMASIPAPRVMVVEDIDRSPGVGAFVGEIHARIALALKCVGCVTNGAVRDLPAVQATGFHLFSGSVAVSHAYAHIVEFGQPLIIAGLKINPGDLVHGDCHGVHTIPLEIAREVPEMAAGILAKEREMIALCQSPGFTLDALAGALECIPACIQPDGRSL